MERTLIILKPDATVLALGGGSWAKLGSDGAWWPWLEEQGIALAPLLPSNGGFETNWSQHFIDKCAGQPLKTVSFWVKGARGPDAALRGEWAATNFELGLKYFSHRVARRKLGARLAHRLDRRVLKKAFAVYLLATALSVVIKAF